MTPHFELPIDFVFNICEGGSGRNRESQVPALVEQFLPGVEISVGLLGNRSPAALRNAGGLKAASGGAGR